MSAGMGIVAVVAILATIAEVLVLLDESGDVTALSALLSRMGYIGKYFTQLFSGSAVMVSTALSLILVFLPLLFPATFKDSSAIPARYLWGAAAVCLFFSGYQIWKRERLALEAEITKHQGSDIHGKLLFGYLDYRLVQIVSDTYVWVNLPRSTAYVNVCVEAVNHNPTPARFRGDDAVVEISVNGTVCRGIYKCTIPGLAVKDVRRHDDKRLRDFFDGKWGAGEGAQLGRPWIGNLGFLVEIDRLLIEQHAQREELFNTTSLPVNLVITIFDTLGKAHPIKGTVGLLIGKLCLASELENADS